MLCMRDSVNKLVVQFPKTNHMTNGFSYNGAARNVAAYLVTLESLVH